VEASGVLIFAAGWILVNPKLVSSFLGSAERESISSVHIWSVVQQSSCTAVYTACTYTQPRNIFTPAMLMVGWSLWTCSLRYWLLIILCISSSQFDCRHSEESKENQGFKCINLLSALSRTTIDASWGKTRIGDGLTNGNWFQ